MNRKSVVNVVTKSVVTLVSIAFGITLTGGKIAGDNRTAISNELGQATSEVRNRNNEKQYFTSNFKNIKDLKKAGHDLIKKIEGEGAVLLENKGDTLPLEKGSKISLLGYNSAHPVFGGRGSSRNKGNSKDAVHLYKALENVGFEMNKPVYDYYMDSYHIDMKDKEDSFFDAYYAEENPKEDLIKRAEADKPYYQEFDVPFSDVSEPASKDKDTLPLAQSSYLSNKLSEYGDAAIYVLTRTASEGSDLRVENDYKYNELELLPNERQILAGLTKMKQEGKIKKIVLLCNTTNQVQQNAFLDFDIDATLWIGHPGNTGFVSVAEILAGDINPSGRLVDAYWYDHKDNPVMKNFGRYLYTNEAEYAGQILNTGDKGNSKGFTSYVAYQEGVYLGYRYLETRYTDVVANRPNAGEFDYDKVVYRPFGYGLSYTTFAQSDFHVTKNNDHTYTVEATITNTGDVAGKDVVQVYVQKPYGEVDIARHIEKPAVELVGFAKTDLIQPGASDKVKIIVDERNFASYDREVDKTYIITEGDYLLTAAKNAHEAAKNFLKKNGFGTDGDENAVASYHLDYDKTTYSVSRADKDVKITNVFDKNDINRFEGRGDNVLEFMSRNNWSKTLTNELHLTQGMVDAINAQQKVNVAKDDGTYPTYGADNGLVLADLIKDANGNNIAYDDPLWDKLLDQLTWNDTVQLLLDGLRTTPVSTAINKPGTKDHNGPTGITQKYSFGDGLANLLNDPDKNESAPTYPTVPVLAATFNSELASDYGTMLGEDALWAGYNGLYGIGLNTHRSPYEGRAFEYWSEDPFLAGTLAATQVRHLQAKGCNAFVKHFALNDQETQRFGIGVWSNEQALREIYLRSFEYAVVDGGAMNAMASFSRIGLELCPASHGLLTDFLRKECGMKGFVVTDMFTFGYTEEQMPNFMLAGCELPDGTLRNAVGKTVYDQFAKDHSEVAWAMREAAHRICYATVRSNAMNGFDSNTLVAKITPEWEQNLNILTLVISILFGVTIAGGAVALVLNNYVFKSKKVKEN